MSLNTIQLDPFLVAGLYPELLVETGATTVPEKKVQSYLGNNARQIIIVVQHDSVPFLPDHELNFLSNVLAACKLSLADIAIVNIAKAGKDGVAGIIESEGRIVLMFGVGPETIGLPVYFPEFQLQQFNHRTYLHAPGLQTVENNKELKLKLWNNLKTLFGL